MRLESARYPLRIGVTGHRNLKDEVAVANAVARTLVHIEETLLGAASQSGASRNAFSRLLDRAALVLVRPALKLFRLPMPSKGGWITRDTD